MERYSTEQSVLNSPKNQVKPLRLCVEQLLLAYFKELDGQQTTDLYNLVLSEVEMPLLTIVLNQVNGNQSKASDILGLNRGTLRKKLKQYNLL